MAEKFIIEGGKPLEGEIEVKDEVVYYKGHRLHGVVVDKLISMLRAGLKDSAPLTNFITRLQANPSANSVNELYSFSMDDYYSRIVGDDQSADLSMGRLNINSVSDAEIVVDKMILTILVY